MNGFHSLAELLLVNGYDPNGDHYECLGPAVDAKNASMIELLLRYGADPNATDIQAVLETYDRAIMEFFMAVGVDLCAGNAVAHALRHKARPLLGFIKTWKERLPGLQRQIDIALRHFAEEKDERGVALMLWLGADPYTSVPSLDGGEEDEDLYDCALRAAMWRGNETNIRNLLKVPIPRERVASLFRSASHSGQPEIIRKLLALGADPNAQEEGRHVLHGFVSAVTRGWSRDVDRDRRGLEAIRMVAAAGAQWQLDSKGLASLRRDLLRGESSTVIALIEIFREFQVLSDEQIQELTRTEGIKRVLRGYTRPFRDPFAPVRQPVYVAPEPTTPTRTGYWKRHWSPR